MSQQDDLDHASVGPEFIKEGADWLAIFNPKVPRAMDVSLARKLVHQKVVCSVRLSADASALAVGLDGTLIYYDLGTGQKFTFELTADEARNYVRGVAFSPDGIYLASGSEDRLVRIWDIKSKSLLHTLHGHKGQVYDLAYSADGKLLLSACGDRTIRVWDLANVASSSPESIESSCRVLTDGASASSDVAFTSAAISQDMHFIAGGSLDGVIRVWDLWAMPEDINELQGAKLVARLRGHEKSVYSVRFMDGFSAEERGEFLVSGSLDKTLKLWEVGPFDDGAGVRDDTFVKTLEGHKDYVLATSTLREGLNFRVASASRDGQVRVWDLKSGKALFLIQGHKNTVTSLDLSRDGKQLVTGSGDCEVRIWNYNIL